LSYRVNAIVLAVLGGLGALQIKTVSAATLSYELTGNSPTRTGNGVGTTYTSLPVSDIYGNSVAASGLIPTTNYSFYDDFLISIPAGQFETLAASINQGTLSVNNLQVRLYDTATNPTSTLPVLGVPNPKSIVGWSSSISVAPGATATYSVIPTTTLGQGTYVLEVRGVTGTSGGSYAGVLNLTPVPLPAALPLLLSGIGLFGAAARRKARGPC
jgi:hypothetical protein